MKTQHDPKDTLPIVESMPQAAAVTGMPLAAIKAAKRAGCPAFVTGNRIRLEPLLKWFFAEFLTKGKSDLPEGLASWRDALNRVQTQREELRLSQERGEMMLTADAEREAAEAMGYTFSELDRILNETPPALAGLTAVEIYKRLSAAIERMRKELREKFEGPKP